MTSVNMHGFELLVDWEMEERKPVIHAVYCNTFPVPLFRLYRSFPTVEALEEAVAEALMANPYNKLYD